jgi:hypothetical protein
LRKSKVPDRGEKTCAELCFSHGCCAFLQWVRRLIRSPLKNGDRLTGTIVKSDAKILLIKTAFAGDVNVQWDAVSDIVSSQTLHLALKDGQTIVGTVTTSDSKFDVTTKDTGAVAAPKDAVVAVRNDAEQKTYDDQIERLRHPHLTDFWSGVLDTGLSMTRGNSDSLTYSLAGKAARVTERDKISFYTTAIYANSSVNGVSNTTAHAIAGGVRGDLNVSEKIFVFGFTDFAYDAFQHLDLRNVIGGGLGYHVIKTPNTTFDVFGGGDFDQEYFSPNPPTTPTSTTRKSGEIVIGEELATKNEQPHHAERAVCVLSKPYGHRELPLPIQHYSRDETEGLAKLAGELHRRLPERSASRLEEE